MFICKMYANKQTYSVKIGSSLAQTEINEETTPITSVKYGKC